MCAQPLPNPNNKNSQQVYNIQGKNFQTYIITPLDLNVQPRSGRVLEKNSSSIVIKEYEKDDLSEKDTSLHQEESPQK